ncbi:MAG: hypothetical protein ACP5QZ_04745 [Candidatus Sumerlaeaceae bacterium]
MKKLLTVATIAALAAVPLVGEAKAAPKKSHAPKKVVVCEPVYTAPCFNPLAPVAAVFHGTAMFVGAVGDGIASIFACPAK